ncbi:unnamed protein product [Anisakis simplex]|uniref:DDE_Tnp_IS1595 domain-containing protein n=1 Tax=Anisakis simplex TaxID=6269 RepID=A0A0M3JTE4_ANISI|nr:unnamed protein product [Anisakis simplex]
MEALKGLKLRDLYRIVNQPNEEFDAFLQNLGLLPRGKTCECGYNMSLGFKDKNKRSPIFRCFKAGCRKNKGFFVGTFFEQSRLTTKEVFELSYFWTRNNYTQEEIAFQMEREDGTSLSTQTITDWNNSFRDIAVEYCVNHPAKLGGTDRTVEIDETIIAKRRYGRGRDVREQLIFFGVDVESGDCFLVRVSDRSAATLLPIIQEHILPGTTVVSDDWATYRQLQSVQSPNSMFNFVNPETYACMNRNESLWHKFKSSHKSRYGTHRSLLSAYVEEYVWRKRFRGPDAFYELWNQIKTLYPC